MSDLFKKFALQYQANGWGAVPVVPPRGVGCSCPKGLTCPSPGKHPAIPWGGKDLNLDVFDRDKVDAWWTEHPAQNVGVPSGPISGLLFVDFDPKNGGRATYDSLVKQYGEFPKTPTFDTGGGGFQFVLQYPMAVISNRTGILPGMDVRAFGGYSVFPPSVHRTGKHYKWREGLNPARISVAALPSWLLDLLLSTENGTHKNAADYIDRTVIPEEGRRNDYLSSTFATFRNVFPRELAEPLGIMLARYLEQGDDWAIASFDRLYGKAARRPPRSQFEREQRASQEKGSGIKLLDTKSAWDLDRPRPEYMIHKMLTEKDIAVMAAPPEMAKSLIGLHLALCVATGKPVFGQFPVDKQRKVLYVNSENPDDLFLDRVRNTANGLKLTHEDFNDWLIITQEQKIRIGDRLPDNARIEELIEQHEIGLIVWDSLIAFQEGDTDSPQETRSFFDVTFRWWRLTYGVSSLVLAHTRKPDPKRFTWSKASDNEILNSIRGSSDIPASAERVIATWKTYEEEDAFGPDIRVLFRTPKARRGDKLPTMELHIHNPDLNTTVFEVDHTERKGISKRAELYVNALLKGGPMPLKVLADELGKHIERDSKTARRWIDKFAGEGIVAIEPDNNGHNERKVSLILGIVP